MGTLSSAKADARPDRARFGVLAFACSLSLITYLDRICIMRVSKSIREDLGFAPLQLGTWEFSALDQMGWVFAAFAVGYALFEVPGGWMGDRWGARRVLMRIVIWWSIFTALTGLIFPTPAWPAAALFLMIVVRFLFGAGEAGAYPNLTRVVRVWFPVHQRARAQGAIWMSARLGGAIAPTVIGLLTSHLGDPNKPLAWHPAFWVLGALGVFWAILFYCFYRDGPLRPVPPSPETERPDAAAPGREPPALIVLGSSLTVWALSFASFCVGLGWYFYPTWQPEYLSEVYGISYQDSQILTGLPFVCGAAGCALGGLLSDWLIRRTGSRRWGRSLMGVVGFGLAGCCVFATGLTASWWQAVLLLCLAFFFNDFAVPIMWSVCADVGGRFVGSVAGVMNMANAVGAVLSPMLIPLLLDHLWPAPPPSTGLAVGCFAITALPSSSGASDRWQYVFAALASTWFVGSAAWLFVNAGKPIFGEQPAKPQAANRDQ